ncbi:hypothetical protein BC739_006692 [Kutzneria viridogrisea]|uniref:C2H2-type domain-containing protein n=1 Tax=Kutzneria viridogrisea TaxID=47990 RepID=A0ABR6BRD8_9PSEU|nr:hypothetical protein [Kutzneria viridogrisea]
MHQRSDILDYDPDGNSYLRRSVFRASSVDIRIAHLPETCDGEIRRLIHTALDPRTVDLSSLIHTVTDPQTWDVVGVAVCGAHLLPMYRPTCASSQWYACRACLELYRLLKDLREHQPILRHLASINQLAA